MKYIYNISGVRIRCTLPFVLTVQRESENFILPDDSAPCDLDFDCRAVDTLEMPKNYHRMINTLFCGNSAYFCLGPNCAPYARVCWYAEEQRVTCDYLAAHENELRYSHNLCSLLQLENLLAFHDGILLHSSFIRSHGHGILFSAPSGTGKSTQAELWAQHENAEIINGDRAAIRLIDRKWTAFGLPYAGSSMIYRNESAPLAAIVILRQAEKNTMHRLPPRQAWKLLLSETTVHHWDKSFLNMTLSRIEQLVAEIPVYLLECRPDKAAVELAYDTIFKESKV